MGCFQKYTKNLVFSPGHLRQPRRQRRTPFHYRHPFSIKPLSHAGDRVALEKLRSICPLDPLYSYIPTNIPIFHPLRSLRIRFLDRCVLRPSRHAIDLGDLTRCELSLRLSHPDRTATIEAFVSTNQPPGAVPTATPPQDATEIADWSNISPPRTLLIKFPGTAGRAERSSPFPANLMPSCNNEAIAGVSSQGTDGLLNSDALSRRAEPSVDNLDSRRAEPSVDNLDSRRAEPSVDNSGSRRAEPSVDNSGSRRAEPSVDNADHYEVWTWNPPGYGRSSGRASLTKLVSAAEAFASQVSLARCGPNTRIWLCGNSLGCLPVLSLSARLSEWLPQRVATDRCLLWLRNPPDLANTILRVADRYASRFWMQRLVAHLPDQLNAVDNAAKSTLPAVFLMSEHDQLVPPPIQRSIHEAYAGEHRVVTLTDLDHGGPVDEQHRDAVQSALNWLTSKAPSSLNSP